jgi:hypothetical protein
MMLLDFAVGCRHCKKIGQKNWTSAPILGTSGIEPEVGLEPTTLRLSPR